MARSVCAAASGVALASVLALGCASDNVAFRPIVETGRVGATRPATNYTLRSPKSGAVIGEAAIWTEGTRKEEGSRSVDVRMRIHNRTEAPMELDLANTELHVTTNDAASVTVKQAEHVSGTLQVDGGKTSGLAVSYPLPEKFDPKNIAEFDLSWRLRTRGGEVVSATTPFVPVDPTLESDDPMMCSSTYPGDRAVSCTNGDWWETYGYYDGESDPALPTSFGPVP